MMLAQLVTEEAVSKRLESEPWCQGLSKESSGGNINTCRIFIRNETAA